ncbi:MAG: serine/threonine protein kinase [Acidobacteria bacterium]|nr:serine/threonine protein kinase [Acidobacteriota bacterium]
MTGQEKRTHKRFRAALRAEGRIQDKVFPVWCFDFSARGFGCYLPKQFQGKGFELLFSIHQERDFVFLIQIAHAQTSEFNHQPCLRIGGRIEAYPPNPQVFFQALGEKLKQAKAEAQAANANPEQDHSQSKTEIVENPTSKIERRFDRRFPTQVPAFTRLDEKGYRLKVLDLSKKGLTVEAGEDFPQTSRFEMIIQPTDFSPVRLEVLEKNRQLIQGSNGLRTRLGLRIVRVGSDYHEYFNQITNQGKSAEITKTVTLDRVEIKTPGSLPTLSEEDGTDRTGNVLFGSIRYRFEKRLGKGGFAEVYLVRDLSLNRLIAMKVLNAQFSQDLKLSYRFIAEAQIAAQFQHPNIATVYEVGEILLEKYPETLEFPAEVLARYPQRMVYFTMQYIQGKSLAELLKIQGKLAVEPCLDYLKRTAMALEYAHQKGVIHRDIKPENIMLTQDHQVLVTDFGIAKVLAHNEVDPDAGPQAGGEQNKTQGFMGTPIYSAPEQITSAGVDNRSDLYALGVTAYELLSGKPPFKGGTWMETIAMHLQREAEPLIEKDAQISQNLSDFVLRLLAKNPVDRFQNAGDVVKALEAIQHHYTEPELAVSAMSEIDQESLDLANQTFIQFSKTYRIVGTYPENHELVTKAIAELHHRFELLLQKHERLDFKVESMALIFNRQEVLKEDQKENSLLFNLYRDGIRTLFFYRGLSIEEIHQFILRLFRYVNDRKSFEEDSVTLLFQLGLQYIDFEYVDAFYEDLDSLRRIKALQEMAFSERTFSLEEMESESEPLGGPLNFFGQLDAHYKKLALGQLQKYFSTYLEPTMRREGVKILMFLIQKEGAGSVFDHEFEILEEVLFSNINQNDLELAVKILEELQNWSNILPESDPRQVAARVMNLRERLSDETFLNELIEKFFFVDRAFRDDIRKICKHLVPSLTVKILFARFKRETEEWKKRFLAEMCVVASGAVLTPLMKMGMELPDEDATILLSGFTKSEVALGKSIFEKWAQHPGPTTRAHLARLALNFLPDTHPLIVRIGSDTNPKYQEARTVAWQYLSQKDPQAYGRILDRFLNLDTYLTYGVSERKMLLEWAQQRAEEASLQFLADLLMEHQTIGADRIPPEEKVQVADILALTNSEVGWDAIQKVSKRLMGNRSVIQHCKALMSRRP